MSIETVDHGVKVNDSLTTVCSSNHEGFARLLTLYARPGYTIADVTYGNGVFWKEVDRSLYQLLLTDLKTDGTDFRALPYADGSLDMLVCDPPYRYTPERNVRHEDTPGHGKVDGLYSLQAAKLINTQSVLELYYAGMAEAFRTLRLGGFLVLKCQDTIQDGKQIWSHCLLMARAETLGFACRDLLIVTTASPTKSRWERQRHLRKAHSYFLVLRKGGHFPYGMPAVCRR